MNILSKKLALLSLLAVALFMPQQSHAARSIRWPRLFVCIGACVLGYKAYSYFTTPDNSKKELKENNKKTIHIIDRRNFVYNSFYAGHNAKIANEFYKIPEKSQDRILFNDLCYVVMSEKKQLWIPFKYLKENIAEWSEDNKQMTIGEFILDFNNDSLADLNTWFKSIKKMTPGYNILDAKKLKLPCEEFKTVVKNYNNNVSYEKKYFLVDELGDTSKKIKQENLYCYVYDNNGNILYLPIQELTIKLKESKEKNNRITLHDHQVNFEKFTTTDLNNWLVHIENNIDTNEPVPTNCLEYKKICYKNFKNKNN